MMINDNWDDFLKDQPLDIILAVRLQKMVKLEEATKHIERFCEVVDTLAMDKGETLAEQAHWKVQYISNSVLDALVIQNRGYTAVIEMSEKSQALYDAIDQIEHEYRSKRLTLKRITDPDRVLAAGKLLKARAKRRREPSQTT